MAPQVADYLCFFLRFQDCWSTCSCRNAARAQLFRWEGTVLRAVWSLLLSPFLPVLGSLFIGGWAGEMQNVALAFSILYLL